MSWFILVIAGLLEVSWAIGLKYTEGFTKLWPSIGTYLSLISFCITWFVMKRLPVGVAYAVWVGIGLVGTAILGILLFDESAQTLKLISLGLICAGIVGLKLTSS